MSTWNLAGPTTKKMFKLKILSSVSKKFSLFLIPISQAEPPKLMLSRCVMKPKRKTKLVKPQEPTQNNMCPMQSTQTIISLNYAKDL
ncbi:hypothetical protein Bca52824_058516 [Brassica carinata]|uniref:Uncharacterized protein n=1 Tax=Brassica carinata TaxID=52824 RepID=A0A8X7UH97_BRACI|nr:hypothetical protein Bca52824_058516 [Brassica carinata]